MDKLPRGLADVVEPLREADAYQRLQEIRQRGFYNVVTGLPMFLFLLPMWISRLLPSAAEDGLGAWDVIRLVIWLALFTLFVMSCFPKTFLPLVRRLRPDWTSPLLDAGLLKNRLEKQFWFQFPFWIAQYLVIPVFVVFLFARALSETPLQLPDSFVLARLAAPVVFLAAMVTLAWQAWRSRDRLVMSGFLAGIPIGLATALLDPMHQWPSLVFLQVFSVALVAPPLIAGLLRLLAPRRWLLH